MSRDILVRQRPAMAFERGQTTRIRYRDEGDHIVSIVEHSPDATASDIGFAIRRAEADQAAAREGRITHDPAGRIS